MKPKSISLSLIRTDAGTQSRADINLSVVKDYAERMKAGDPFPPVTVFYDGKEYFLADGFHRVNAEMLNNADEIEADVRTGSRIDALMFSLGANLANGLQRSNADKRHCVEIALTECPKLSSRAIAKLCGVSDALVGSVRQVQADCTSQNLPTKREGADGKSYPATQHGKPKVTEILTTSPGDVALTGKKTPVPFLTLAPPVASPGSIEPVHVDRLSSALETSMSDEYRKIQNAITLVPPPRPEVAGNLHFLKGYWNRASIAERKEFLLWVQTEEAAKEKAQAV